MKKLFFIIAIAALPLVGGAVSVQTVKITGHDELHNADVVLEDGARKLVVKSTIVPEAVGNLFFKHSFNGTSEDMDVDGSTTTVVFTVEAETNYDLLVYGLAFHSFASGIKIDKFLSLNSELTNGVLVEIKSSNQIFQFLPIKTTQDFDAHFTWGSGRSFELIFASGNDSLVARYGPSSPFVIKKKGTYGAGNDDYIKIHIQDNLSAIARLRFLAVGNRKQ